MASLNYEYTRAQIAGRSELLVGAQREEAQALLRFFSAVLQMDMPRVELRKVNQLNQFGQRENMIDMPGGVLTWYVGDRYATGRDSWVEEVIHIFTIQGNPELKRLDAEIRATTHPEANVLITLIFNPEKARQLYEELRQRIQNIFIWAGYTEMIGKYCSVRYAGQPTEIDPQVQVLFFQNVFQEFSQFRQKLQDIERSITPESEHLEVAEAYIALNELLMQAWDYGYRLGSLIGGLLVTLQIGAPSKEMILSTPKIFPEIIEIMKAFAQKDFSVAECQAKLKELFSVLKVEQR